MANEGKYNDWSAVEEKTNNSSDIKYVKFAAGETVRVRLLAQPFFYDQYFLRKEDIGGDDNVSIVSPGKGDPLPNVGINPSAKCAVNVFNRDDNNEVQILRCGPSIYNAFVNWSKKNKVNPGSNDGCDFEIDATGTGLKRRYTVTALLQTPFSKDERALLSDKATGNGIYKLEKIFKPSTIEDINEIIEKYNLGKVSGDNAELDAPSTP
ncbi:MAG: hypothetical protein ACXAAM_06400, partial [Candidatus Heimdallarchaeaceae archaeon]